MLRARLERHPRGGARDRRARARRDRARPLGTSVIFVDAYLVDWLDLLIRWLHVVAAIVWIGTSFYFVALDSHLLPPRKSRDSDEGVGGESWEIHGGGFYRIHKFRVAPETIPEPLHWYKWEAYTTWLSGFALLVVLYYLDADTYLVDPSVRDLGTGTAIAISIALLARGVARLRRALPRCSATASSLLARRARRVRRRVRVRGERALQRAGHADPGRRDARDDDGRQRPLRDHPGPLGARAREARRSRARPGARDQGQAALGAQQLPDAARRAGDARAALPVCLCARARLARPRRADARRRVDPPLLQPPPPRPDGLVRSRRAPRSRCSRSRSRSAPTTPSPRARRRCRSRRSPRSSSSAARSATR